ncbi:MAG: hypothetical protein R8K22_05720 [Mariprofundaceae bacterium]
MTDLVRFSFALSPRIQSFLELRDGLRCLEHARHFDQPYAWMLAASDLRASLLGEHGRRQALPELTGLLTAMRIRLSQLAEEHPQFRTQMLESGDHLEGHKTSMRQGIQDATDFLCTDALLNNYANALKKQDVIAHKLTLPQSLHMLWNAGDYKNQLSQSLQDVYAAVSHLDAMLNDFVAWDHRIAKLGTDQITPERGKEFGLLVFGLDPSYVRQGILPNYSGNHLAIRVRFQQWQTGLKASEISEDQPYSVMLVPVA